MRGPSRRVLCRTAGCLLGLLIGVATVVTVNASFSLLAGNDLELIQEDRSVFLVRATIAAIPFCCLALAGVAAKTPWTTAAILTAMFWGIFIADVLTDQCKCGVNIGLALLLFFSPLIITPGAFASGYVVRRLTNTPRPPDATGP